MRDFGYVVWRRRFPTDIDLSCAMGFDCDNQAATISGLLGVMYGAKSLPRKFD